MKYSVVGDSLGDAIGLFDSFHDALRYAESIIKKELPEEDIKIDDEFSLFGYGYEIMKIEELGVLVDPKRSYFIGNNRDGFPLYTVNTEYAHKLTRKEAEQFPQFEWVALSEL
ncbi:hypothetical protein ACRPLU_00515 [Streptococcus uberis]|uniref:hypothetical protein n=1 Tax=Streptococcus uberis TaxID=1349 RepID=UPI003D6BEBA9